MIVNNKQIVKLLRKKYSSNGNDYEYEMSFGDGNKLDEEEDEPSVGEEGKVASPPKMKGFNNT